MNLTSVKLRVTGAKACARVTGRLTSGMVGLPVTIECDGAWDGLTKNLVCRCGQEGEEGAEVRSVLGVGDTAAVAHEVMKAGMHLYLGVEGFSSDGKLVIPTTWAMCGWIESGANTDADPSADPTLPVWDQLQAKIDQIECGSFTPEQLEEVRACADAAARAEENAVAASRQAEGHAASAEAVAQAAQIYMENARTSAAGAANMANDAYRYQTAAVAAAERAEAAADSIQGSGVTPAQIDALNGMFQAAAYDENSDYAAAYAAFCAAFGINEPGGSEGGDTPGGDNGGSGGEDSGGEETGVSNETVWTDGVAYSFEPVVDEQLHADGTISPYSGWNRTPYLYCRGAAVLRVVVNKTTSMMGSNNQYNAFYDADKAYISSFAYNGIDRTTVGAYMDMTVPENAVYFIASHKAGVIGVGSTTSEAAGFVPYAEVPV